MSTCFDIYVLPSTGCTDVWAYPSAPHIIPPPTPTTTGGGGGHPEMISREWHDTYHDDEESILAALGLFGPDL
jgi:hypothetical protein